MAIDAPPPQVVHRIPSAVDRVVLGLHIAAAAAVGVIGFFQTTDPDWGGLQRIAIATMVGAWGLGIFVTWLVARRFRSQLLRLAVLLGGPIVILMTLLAALFV